MNLVPIARFSQRMDAEVARALLDSEGIQAFVRADDAAGFYPGLERLTGGVHLLVAAGDQEAAVEILQVPPEQGMPIAPRRSRIQQVGMPLARLAVFAMLAGIALAALVALGRLLGLLFVGTV